MLKIQLKFPFSCFLPPSFPHSLFYKNKNFPNAVRNPSSWFALKYDGIAIKIFQGVRSFKCHRTAGCFYTELFRKEVLIAVLLLGRGKERTNFKIFFKESANLRSAKL